MGTSSASHRFEYLGWKVTIVLARGDDALVAGYAELRGADEAQHRICLSAGHPTGMAALTDLGRQSRDFIETVRDVRAGHAERAGTAGLAAGFPEPQ